jgi:hypothetical protein
MYILRALQLIIGFGSLADTTSNVRHWHSIDCKSPNKLNYNVAIVCFTQIARALLSNNTFKGCACPAGSDLPSVDYWTAFQASTLSMVCTKTAHN